MLHASLYFIATLKRTISINSKDLRSSGSANATKMTRSAPQVLGPFLHLVHV